MSKEINQQVEYELKRARYISNKAGVREIMLMDEIDVIERHRIKFSSCKFPYETEITTLDDGFTVAGVEIGDTQILIGGDMEKNWGINILRFELCVMAFIDFFDKNPGSGGRTFFCTI